MLPSIFETFSDDFLYFYLLIKEFHRLAIACCRPLWGRGPLKMVERAALSHPDTDREGTCMGSFSILETLPNLNSLFS